MAYSNLCRRENTAFFKPTEKNSAKFTATLPDLLHPKLRYLIPLDLNSLVTYLKPDLDLHSQLTELEK